MSSEKLETKQLLLALSGKREDRIDKTVILYEGGFTHTGRQRIFPDIHMVDSPRHIYFYKFGY